MREQVILTSTLVSNGCLDYRGEIADKNKTGGWKAAPFIIVNEVAERFVFFSVAVSMVTYLAKAMHQPVSEAAAHVSIWIGTAYMLTLFGAFLADAYLGRFRTIITFSCVYAVGMLLLALSGSMPSLRPPHCSKRPCERASKSETYFVYAALALIALGTGGIKPCVSSFGADQFDESDPAEAHKKHSFFNWFFFVINMGALFGMTILVYLQVTVGWGWGFGIPTGATIVSILIFVAGGRKYRYQKPMGSAFTRFAQVIVAAVRNHVRGVEVGDDLYEVETAESDIHGTEKLSHTQQYRYLDRAAVMTDPDKKNDRWRVCTITQVEELKSFVRIIPIWASTIALAISLIQMSTFFVAQAHIMNRVLTLTPKFKIPASSIPAISTVNALIFVPVYEKLAVPLLRARTGHPRGLTALQRVGAGLFLSIFAMGAAAAVEIWRKTHTFRGKDKPSVFLLLPQCFLLGTAEIFAYAGQLEFFYEEATEGTRSISSVVFLSGIGIGSFVNAALVTTVERFTGGSKGWLRNGLNKGGLDYFYWILTAVNAVNFLFYLRVSRRYQRKTDTVKPVAEPGGEIGPEVIMWDRIHEIVLTEDDRIIESRVMFSRQISETKSIIPWDGGSGVALLSNGEEERRASSTALQL